MLLVLKFADCLVAFEKRRTAYVTKKTQEANYNKVSDHEENALQYLSGYVLHNLYKKITNSKNYNTDASQQALSFIKSALSLTNFTSQRPVNALNRGGLWFATETAQGIFQQSEYAFREETSGQEVNNIGEIHYHKQNKTNRGKQIEFSAESNQFEKKSKVGINEMFSNC